MKKNRFDLVAPFYDFLAKLIFGETLDKAQTHFLNEVKEGARVLIVGGGTGQILKHSAFHKAERIDYLELSPKMINRAMEKGGWLDNLHFIQGDFFEHSGHYDLIVANFFLDCFSEQNLERAIKKLCDLSESGSKLIITDFQPKPEGKAKALIWLMLIFFRLFASLEAKSLQAIHAAVLVRFKLVEKAEFKNGLIFSALYASSEQSA